MSDSLCNMRAGIDSCSDRELLLVDSVESAAVEVFESAESSWRFTHNRKTSTESYPGDKWTSLCSCWEWFAAISNRKSLSVKVDDLRGWQSWAATVVQYPPIQIKKRDHVIDVKWPTTVYLIQCEVEPHKLWKMSLSVSVWELVKHDLLSCRIVKSLLFSLVCSIYQLLDCGYETNQ